MIIKLNVNQLKVQINVFSCCCLLLYFESLGKPASLASIETQSE